jgi:hypothetical protein
MKQTTFAVTCLFIIQLPFCSARDCKSDATSFSASFVKAMEGSQCPPRDDALSIIRSDLSHITDATAYWRLVHEFQLGTEEEVKRVVVQRNSSWSQADLMKYLMADACYVSSFSLDSYKNAEVVETGMAVAMIKSPSCVHALYPEYIDANRRKYTALVCRYCPFSFARSTLRHFLHEFIKA